MANKKIVLKKENVLDKLPIFAVLVGVSLTAVGLFFIKDDVYSSAKTLFEYFPAKFNVYPASKFENALMLGVFLSLIQAVTMAIVPSKNFSWKLRLSSLIMLIISILLDNWTDVVHRSQYLQGNIYVATGITVGFYTLGSEIATGLGLYLIGLYMRPALSQLMLLWAMLGSLIDVIRSEWNNYVKVAKLRSERYVKERNDELYLKYELENGGHQRKSKNRTPNRPQTRKTPTTSSGNLTGKRVPRKINPHDTNNRKRY